MTAAITDSSGEALFTTTVPHGLSVNDVVYVQSFVENYNGFVYIESVTSTTFTISRSEGGDPVAYIKDITATVNVASSVAWSCVHLPIVYELSSDVYPDNNSATPSTVNSSANDDGLTRLTLSSSSGIIDQYTGTFDELDFIEVIGATSQEVNGVWQILDKASSSQITINLPYNSQHSFAGGSVVRYYSGYHILIKVYAGIDVGHPLYQQKPLELASTLKLIPDSNNNVRFSINEVLKNYVKLKNNLILGTLPNNIDFWVSYYIESAEAYDRSNGYTVASFVSDYTQDSFTGNAVQAKLSFKNIYSGQLSEYVMKGGFLGLFLTLFQTPILFSCEECYQDISCIIDVELSELSLSEWENLDTSFTNWNVSDQPTVTLNGDGAFGDASDIIRREFSGPAGTYPVTFQLTLSVTGNIYVWMYVGYTDDTSDVYATLYTSVSVINDTIDVIANKEVKYIGLYLDRFDSGEPPGNVTYTLNSVSIEGGANASYQEIYFRMIGYNNGVIQEINDEQIAYQGKGVYRLPLSSSCDNDSIVVYVFGTTGVYNDEEIISEIKTIDVNCDCANFNLRLCWLNNLGGFDYWNFTAGSEPQTEIEDTGSKSKNVFPNFPVSYGEYADTLDREQTYRKSFKKILVRSQHVTQEQLEAISYIKSSPLVQIINSRTDRRTVIVDSDSFVRYREYEDKEYNIQFTISYTDDNPSQTA